MFSSIPILLVMWQTVRHWPMQLAATVSNVFPLHYLPALYSHVCRPQRCIQQWTCFDCLLCHLYGWPALWFRPGYSYHRPYHETIPWAIPRYRSRRQLFRGLPQRVDVAFEIYKGTKTCTDCHASQTHDCPFGTWRFDRSPSSGFRCRQVFS